jgi:hypothetical protein
MLQTTNVGVHLRVYVVVATSVVVTCGVVGSKRKENIQYIFHQQHKNTL